MNKDIKLKRGDIVYTVNEYGFEARGTILNEWSGKSIKNFENNTGRKILKIERPQTIYEVKEILDEKEKEYLSAVIRPFKNRVNNISKIKTINEYICIQLSGIYGHTTEEVCLPYFKKDTMYKGMYRGKKYTLKELGLE
ncbi:MAG TPA: hypothetical protein IAD49_03070 [Candidatus Fimihabitans intestinipullorum]|uniref:Uncharacterized protein n=1 Tax=Candidatus Fimihabitans intestinipullorum TaxID=2840820 RepID=A0A9D1HWJ1_9BACT|nr:hypothetical protein [Candidatus Fimihabitans intestinipullorum]